MELFLPVLTGLGLAAVSVGLLFALAAVSDSPLIGRHRLLAGVHRMPPPRRRRQRDASTVDPSAPSAPSASAAATASSTTRRPAHAAIRESSPARTAGQSSTMTE
jgi:hypothetical protein